MPVLQGEAIHTAETIHEPLPDLMAEYHDVQLSLCGLTGTPEELIIECPLKRDQMTLEAKNMFLVMAMNESETAISEKHLSYFQKITESRGVELKVTLREETDTPLQAELKEARAQEKAPATIQKAAEPVKVPHYEMEHQPKIQETAKDMHAANPQASKITENYSKEPANHDVDETTTEQMDIWLMQLQHEYEVRFPDLKINDEPLDDTVMTKPDVSKQGYENEQTYEPIVLGTAEIEAPVSTEEKTAAEPVSIEADDAILPEAETDFSEPATETHFNPLPIEVDDLGTADTESMVEPLMMGEPEQENAALIAVEDTAEIPVLMEMEESGVDRFTEFMASLPEPSGAVTLKSVQEEAQQLPAEETFVRLARLIETLPPEGTEELYAVIVQAYEAVDACLDTMDPDALSLPPETIEKIATLLDYLGYKNSEAALESLLSRHDLEFLSQALRYLAQLHEDNRQEFWQPFANGKSYAQTARPGLGKLLLQLLGVQKLIPANVK